MIWASFWIFPDPGVSLTGMAFPLIKARGEEGHSEKMEQFHLPGVIS
jgi:hypothetical protein